MRRLLGIAAGAAALAFAAGGAQATELVFTITGAGNIITFDLPQDPTPGFLYTRPILYFYLGRWNFRWNSDSI